MSAKISDPAFPGNDVLGTLDVGNEVRSKEALREAGALQTAIFNSVNFSSIATDANGVIQIFTKRGAPGSTRINVSTRATLGQLERHLPFNREPAPDAQGNPMPVYDHEAILFRDAWGNQTDVSVSGGADQTRFYLSAGYALDEGIMRGASHEKLSTRLNLDQALGSWLTLAGGANYIRSHSDLVINGENGTGGLLTAGAGRVRIFDLDAASTRRTWGAFTVRPRNR